MNEQQGYPVATKQQERDALVKIREIVEALGEDSYIGTAFTGVFNTAEQNIEFDAAFSLAEEARLARQEAKETSAEIADLRAENERLHEAEKNSAASLARTAADFTRERESNDENYRLRRDAEYALDKANAVIVTLKAKLYDMITAGA